MLKRVALRFVVLAAALGAVETGASLIAAGEPGLGLPAEAIVGRPLTPVSVAGGARCGAALHPAMCASCRGTERDCRHMKLQREYRCG